VIDIIADGICRNRLLLSYKEGYFKLVRD